jgi:hypothetical protein
MVFNVELADTEKGRCGRYLHYASVPPNSRNLEGIAETMRFLRL